MNHDSPIDLQALWQRQPSAAKAFSLEEIRGKATRFQRVIRWRNVREYVASAIVIALFGKDALFASSLLAKAGSSLVVLGTLFIAWRLFTRAASIPVPFANEVDRGLGEACIRFHQRELERQRDLLRTVWRWYLGPLVPGFLVLFASRFVDAWAKGRGPIIACLGSALLVVLVFAGVGWLNARGARKLQWEIDALDRSNEGL